MVRWRDREEIGEFGMITLSIFLIASIYFSRQWIPGCYSHDYWDVYSMVNNFDFEISSPPPNRPYFLLLTRQFLLHNYRPSFF